MRTSPLHLLALLLCVGACGDDNTAPTQGALQVNMITFGTSPDTNGYVVTIDSSMSRRIPPNGSSRRA